MPEIVSRKGNLPEQICEIPAGQVIGDGLSIFRDIVASPALEQASVDVEITGAEAYRPAPLPGLKLHAGGVARLEVTNSALLAGFIRSAGRVPEEVACKVLKDAAEALVEDDPTLCEPMNVIIGGVGAIHAHRWMRRYHPTDQGVGNNLRLAGFMVVGDAGNGLGLSKLRIERSLAHYSLAGMELPDRRRIKDKSSWRPHVVLARVDMAGEQRVTVQEIAEASVVALGDRQIPATLGPAYLITGPPSSNFLDTLHPRRSS